MSGELEEVKRELKELREKVARLEQGATAKRRNEERERLQPSAPWPRMTGGVR